MKEPREKQHRLPHERYQGQQTLAITARIRDCSDLFTGPRAAVDFSRILFDETEKAESDVLLACFMPDHLHALIRGREATSRGLDAFYRFKLRSGILLDRFYRPARWQKDFYDHLVRNDSDWGGQAKYFALNPVRAGLVDDPFDYPHTYSSLGETREVLSQIFWD